jgi:hypothetical protein
MPSTLGRAAEDPIRARGSGASGQSPPVTRCRTLIRGAQVVDHLSPGSRSESAASRPKRYSDSPAAWRASSRLVQVRKRVISPPRN